jgi:hypothetical protein
MTISQTVEIPANRRISLDLPLHLPLGKAKVELIVTPETALQKKAVPPLASLLGVDKERDTMEAYFERKRKDKEFENSLFERNINRQIII